MDFWFVVVCLFYLVLETGFLCVTALAVLELALYTRLVSNSQRPAILYLLSAGFKGIRYHAQPFSVFVSNGFMTLEKRHFTDSLKEDKDI